MRTSTVIFMTIALASIVPVAVADSPKSAGSVQELLHQPLPNMSQPDVVVITVDYPPGASTPPHEHPGATYAYVLKGAVVSQLGDEQPHTYTEGQLWSETPHQRHVLSRNASATDPARLLVFFVAPHGEELTTILPSKP